MPFIGGHTAKPVDMHDTIVNIAKEARAVVRADRHDTSPATDRR